MSSPPLSLPSRLWIEQLRRATPGPFAEVRAQLLSTHGELAGTAPLAACPALERLALAAFEAGWRDDPIAAEQALAEGLGRPPSTALLAALFEACAAVRSMLGPRCFDHTSGPTLGLIH